MPSRMMTTSSPCSTRRLAFSMASSATWVCSSLGRSNVLDDDLALDGAAHVGDLFGPLVDEQHDQLDLGVVALDRRGDRLHDRGLAGLRRRHDDAALALADRRDQVDDPRRHVVGSAGFSRRSFSSGNSAVRSSNRGPGLGLLGIAAVDGVDLEHRRVLLVAAGRAAEAGDVVALAQPVLAGQLDRDVGVVAAGQVAVDPQEAVALVAQVEVAGDVDWLHVDRRTGVVAIGTIGTVGSIEPLLVAALRTFAATLVAAPPAPSAVAALGITVAVGIAIVTVAAVRRVRRGTRRRGCRRHRQSVTATSPDLMSAISQSANGSPSGPRIDLWLRPSQRPGGVVPLAQRPTAATAARIGLDGRRLEPARAPLPWLPCGAAVGRRQRTPWHGVNLHQWSPGSCRSASPLRHALLS